MWNEGFDANQPICLYVIHIRIPYCPNWRKKTSHTKFGSLYSRKVIWKRVALYPVQVIPNVVDITAELCVIIFIFLFLSYCGFCNVRSPPMTVFRLIRRILRTINYRWCINSDKADTPPCQSQNTTIHCILKMKHIIIGKEAILSPMQIQGTHLGV